jgi:hypothetical protein|tara:strand:+ start:43445 stop:43942 length:498 start_codon:yes stop_codon:yes gene_type:complete
LRSKRRIAQTDPRAVRTVTAGASRKPAFAIAAQIKLRRRAIARVRRARGTFGHRQTGVVICNLLAGGPVEVVGDPDHLRMPALALGKICELAKLVSGVEAREAGDQITVPFPFEAVTGDAGPTRTRIPSAQCDNLAGDLVPVDSRFGLIARCDQRQHGNAHGYRG